MARQSDRRPLSYTARNGRRYVRFRVDVAVPEGAIAWVQERFACSRTRAIEMIRDELRVHASLATSSLGVSSLDGRLTIDRNFESEPCEGERWFDCSDHTARRMEDGNAVEEVPGESGEG